MAQEAVVQTLIEEIAKHWGYEVGDKIRQEIEKVINATDVDLDKLNSAIQTIQGLLDADEGTEEFDVGQNIVTQLTDHLSRITNLEASVNTLKADETTVGSVAYAVKQERTRAQAVEANLQSGVDANTASIDTLNGDETVEGSVKNVAKSYMDAEAGRAQTAEAELQSQIDDLTGGSTGSISSLQSEIDTVEIGVGLNEDGSYSPNTAANYIDGATSVIDSANILDGELKRVEDKVDSNKTLADNAIAGLDARATTLESTVSTLNGDETVEGSVKKQVADAKSEVKAYADTAAQNAATQAKAEAVVQAKGEVYDTFANISAATLASMFRKAMDCAFNGTPKDDVLNGTGECAEAGNGGDSGDGAVI